MRRRPRRLVLFPALLAGLGAPLCAATSAGAQEVARPPVYRSNNPYASDVAAQQPQDSRFGVTGGVDFRDQYFFRGYEFSTGLSVQPYFDVMYTVYKDENLSVTPHAGAWFNFTEEQGEENPVHWQEFDANVGIAVEVAHFTLDFQWMLYTSPNETFQRSEEIGVEVAYDDSRFWPDGPVAALNPSVSFFHEYYDQNDSESDAYVGLGLEPELRTFQVGPLPVTVSFPLTFGGSYNGYYFNDENQVDQAGFWSAGVKAGFDLPRGEYGPQWRIEAEATYIRLLADSVERANGGDRDDIALRVGITFEL